MPNDMRDRLMKLLNQVRGNEIALADYEADILIDHLLANGVILPPCKVGDTVYRHNIRVWHSECCDCEHYLIGGFGDPSECGRTKNGLKHPDCIEITEEVVSQHDIFLYLYTNAFGKTVFLTREDAEKALKERESK